MDPFPDSAEDKRELARRVGKVLVSARGRQEAYPPHVIVEAVRQLDYPQGWNRWALALFASAYDFGIYHSARGMELDYVALRRGMLLAIKPDAPELRRVQAERGYYPAQHRDGSPVDQMIDDGWWSGPWSLLDLLALLLPPW